MAIRPARGADRRTVGARARRSRSHRRWLDNAQI